MSYLVSDWREESLRFELAGVGIGSASFGVLALASVIPFFLKLRKFQIGANLSSMGLCFISGKLTILTEFNPNEPNLTIIYLIFIEIFAITIPAKLRPHEPGKFWLLANIDPHE